MIALDTNVLARAFAFDDPKQSPLAQSFLADLSEEKQGFINLTVVIELYWVLRNVLRFDADQVNDLVERMLATVAFEIEDGESVGEALDQARNGADFADALINATSRLYGIAETVTFDRDAARRFGWRLLA